MASAACCLCRSAVASFPTQRSYKARAALRCRSASKVFRSDTSDSIEAPWQMGTWRNLKKWHFRFLDVGKSMKNHRKIMETHPLRLFFVDLEMDRKTGSVQIDPRCWSVDLHCPIHSFLPSSIVPIYPIYPLCGCKSIPFVVDYSSLIHFLQVKHQANSSNLWTTSLINCDFRLFWQFLPFFLGEIYISHPFRFVQNMIWTRSPQLPGVPHLRSKRLAVDCGRRRWGRGCCSRSRPSRPLGAATWRLLSIGFIRYDNYIYIFNILWYNDGKIIGYLYILMMIMIIMIIISIGW